MNNRAGLVNKDITNVDISPISKKHAQDDMVIVDVFARSLKMVMPVR